jgi:hypothetical protein
MVEVRQSTIIDAPIADVWRILRDFNGHDRWHPAVATSAIEGGGPTDAVGSVRRFRLANGGELREQLLSLSDAHCSLTYCLLEAPLPLMGYVASIRLKRVTDGDRTFWEWRSEFRPPRHRQDELVRLVTQDIYQGGFAAIRHLLDRRANGAKQLRLRLLRRVRSRARRSCWGPKRLLSLATAARRCCDSNMSTCPSRNAAKFASDMRRSASISSTCIAGPAILTS